MQVRCIFVALLGLVGSCAAPETQALQASLGAPPSNRAAPILPRSDQGLDATWFLGVWQVQDSPCTLELGHDAQSALDGPVLAHQCEAPWSESVRWRRGRDGRALFELVTTDGRSLWQAGAIQPTAIAGLSGDGALIRLYWAGDGPNPGWIQP